MNLTKYIEAFEPVPFMSSLEVKELLHGKGMINVIKLINNLSAAYIRRMQDGDKYNNFSEGPINIPDLDTFVVSNEFNALITTVYQAMCNDAFRAEIGTEEKRSIDRFIRRKYGVRFDKVPWEDAIKAATSEKKLDAVLSDWLRAYLSMIGSYINYGSSCLYDLHSLRMYYHLENSILSEETMSNIMRLYHAIPVHLRDKLKIHKDVFEHVGRVDGVRALFVGENTFIGTTLSVSWKDMEDMFVTGSSLKSEELYTDIRFGKNLRKDLEAWCKAVRAYCEGKKTFTVEVPDVGLRTVYVDDWLSETRVIRLRDILDKHVKHIEYNPNCESSQFLNGRFQVTGYLYMDTHYDVFDAVWNYVLPDICRVRPELREVMERFELTAEDLRNLMQRYETYDFDTILTLIDKEGSVR